MLSNTNYYILFKYIDKIKNEINKEIINYDKLNKYMINMKQNIKNDNIEYTDLINMNKFNIDNLPNGINIYTMCASCKLNTRLNIENIEKYLKIDINNIILKKINNDNIDTILPLKKKKKENI